MVLLAAGAMIHAQNVLVPHHSFESPQVTGEVPALPWADSWQQLPKAPWYTPETEAMNGPWNQLVGVFRNTDSSSSDHIPNLDQDQALFLINAPQNGVFQDYLSIGGLDAEPSHEFSARFAPGKAYSLTVGIIGGGGGMVEGASLTLALFYRDATSNIVMIASKPIVHSSRLFPKTTHLVDLSLDIPQVQSSDPWAGQHIGIMLAVSSDFTTAGGYWDVDNIRLLEYEPVTVPNNSFESPEVTGEVPALPWADSWQQLPKAPWYTPEVEAMNGPWNQLAGVFKNTASTNSDHIPNLDQDQALFLINAPQNGLFQDYASIGGLSSEPNHAFDARFEPGKAYQLTVGVIGGGGLMFEGSSLELSLYYRDESSNGVTVASLPIVHSTNLFPATTLLVDLGLQTDVVQPGDPWAGKNIGVKLMVTTSFELSGGYWDLDNVRLRALSAGGLRIDASRDGENLILSWLGQAAMNYQLQVTQDGSAWSNYGAPQSGLDGTISVSIPLIEFARAFFRVQATP